MKKTILLLLGCILFTILGCQETSEEVAEPEEKTAISFDVIQNNQTKTFRFTAAEVASFTNNTSTSIIIFKPKTNGGMYEGEGIQFHALGSLKDKLGETLIGISSVNVVLTTEDHLINSAFNECAGRMNILQNDATVFKAAFEFNGLAEGDSERIDIVNGKIHINLADIKKAN